MLSALPIFFPIFAVHSHSSCCTEALPVSIASLECFMEADTFFLFSMHCIYRFYVYFGSSFQARFICILSSMCLCCSSHSYSHTSIRSISASLAMAKATKKISTAYNTSDMNVRWNEKFVRFKWIQMLSRFGDS